MHFSQWFAAPLVAFWHLAKHFGFGRCDFHCRKAICCCNVSMEPLQYHGSLWSTVLPLAWDLGCRILPTNFVVRIDLEGWGFTTQAPTQIGQWHSFLTKNEWIKILGLDIFRLWSLRDLSSEMNGLRWVRGRQISSRAFQDTIRLITLTQTCSENAYNPKGSAESHHFGCPMVCHKSVPWPDIDNVGSAGVVSGFRLGCPGLDGTTCRSPVMEENIKVYLISGERRAEQEVFQYFGGCKSTCEASSWLKNACFFGWTPFKSFDLSTFFGSLVGRTGLYIESISIQETKSILTFSGDVTEEVLDGDQITLEESTILLNGRGQLSWTDHERHIISKLSGIYAFADEPQTTRMLWNRVSCVSGEPRKLSIALGWPEAERPDITFINQQGREDPTWLEMGCKCQVHVSHVSLMKNVFSTYYEITFCWSRWLGAAESAWDRGRDPGEPGSTAEDLLGRCGWAKPGVLRGSGNLNLHHTRTNGRCRHKLKEFLGWNCKLFIEFAGFRIDDVWFMAAKWLQN